MEEKSKIVVHGLLTHVEAATRVAESNTRQMGIRAAKKGGGARKVAKKLHLASRPRILARNDRARSHA